jgi:hypothetical protein
MCVPSLVVMVPIKLLPVVYGVGMISRHLP